MTISPSRAIIILACLTFLCSCSSMTPITSKRAGVCNTLRSDLIFSGATSNVHQSELETSEQPLQQHTYDKDDCDE